MNKHAGIVETPATLQQDLRRQRLGAAGATSTMLFRARNGAEGFRDEYAKRTPPMTEPSGLSLCTFFLLC